MSYLATAKEALCALRAQSGPEPPRLQGDEPNLSRQRPTAEDAANMTLDEFARAGLTVRIHSRVLGCNVLFVSDNAADGNINAQGPTVYRTHELRKLAVLKPQPHSLRTIHEVKAVFGGVIEEISHG